MMRLFGLRNIFARASAVSGGLAAAVLERPNEAPAPEAVAWTNARIALAEELWGEGFLGPGGAGEILRLAAPLGLSAASSVLLLGAGAGGPALALATEMSAWVACRDRDAALVELAARRLQRAGKALAKRATVAAWRAEVPQFGKNAFHHAIIVEQIGDTEIGATLAALADAVKPGGQIVLVDLVADSPLDAGDREVASWCRLEQRSARLASQEGMTAALAALGFDIRVVEDQSARHMSQALQGWKRLVRAMQAAPPAPAAAAVMVAEAERWTRRLRLMHAGRIRLARWHAIAPT